MEPIWEVVLQMLFYASPVIYVTSTFPDSVEAEAMANPLTAILTQARHVLIDPDAPTAATAIGGTARLLIPLAVVVGSSRCSDSGSSRARRRASRRSSRRVSWPDGNRAERRHVAPLADDELDELRRRVAELERRAGRADGASECRPWPRPRTAATGSTACASTSTP